MSLPCRTPPYYDADEPTCTGFVGVLTKSVRASVKHTPRVLSLHQTRVAISWTRCKQTYPWLPAPLTNLSVIVWLLNKLLILKWILDRLCFWLMYETVLTETVELCVLPVSLLTASRETDAVGSRLIQLTLRAPTRTCCKHKTPKHHGPWTTIPGVTSHMFDECRCVFWVGMDTCFR